MKKHKPIMLPKEAYDQLKLIAGERSLSETAAELISNRYSKVKKAIKANAEEMRKILEAKADQILKELGIEKK